VLSSDRPASRSPISNTVISRFEWGPDRELQPPDIETRLAICEESARLADQMHDDVYQFLATRIRSNVRRLEAR